MAWDVYNDNLENQMVLNHLSDPYFQSFSEEEMDAENDLQANQNWGNEDEFYI